MEIVQVPGIYFGYPHRGSRGRIGESPVAIVHHTMDGWMGNYLKIIRGLVPGFENTAHFSIGVDGVTRQHVPLTDAAWCNGLDWSKGGPAYWKSDLRLDWLVSAFHRGVNPNCLTISIEEEGRSGTPLTTPQLRSTIELDCYLMKIYPAIKPDRIHFVGHYQIDGINKQRCPGSAFPWVPLMEGVNVPITTDQVKTWTKAVEDANTELAAKIQVMEQILGKTPYLERIAVLSGIIHNNGVAFPRHEVGLP